MNSRNRIFYTLLTFTVCVLIASSSIQPAFALADRPTSYALQKGEFPFCIARRFNVDPFQLLRINGLRSGEIYYPGLVLSIPSNMNPFPGSRALQSHSPYTVRAGDTIGTVACYFGDVDPAAILAINELSDPNNLPAGRVLTIPQGSWESSVVEPTAAPAVVVEMTLPAPTNTAAPAAAAGGAAAPTTEAGQVIHPTEAPTATFTTVPPTDVPPTVVPPTNTVVPATNTAVPPTAEPSNTALPAASVTAAVTPEPQITAYPAPQVRQLNILEKFWFIAGEIWQKVFKPAAPAPVAVIQPAATERPSEIPFPSETPLSTETPLPTWTPTATEIPTLQLDLKDLNSELPSDVIEELFVGGMGGGGGFCSKRGTPEMFLPFPAAFIKTRSENTHQVSDGELVPVLDTNLLLETCGWDPGDVLTAELTYPAGKVERQTVQVTGGGTDDEGYWADIYFYIGLDEPEGDYRYTIKASGGRSAQGAIRLQASVGPHVRFTHSGPTIDHYFLYGFAPYEQVRLIVYSNNNQTEFMKMVGWTIVQVNEKGKLDIDLHLQEHQPASVHPYSFVRDDPSYVYLFAVGQRSGEAKSLPITGLVSTDPSFGKGVIK